MRIVQVVYFFQRFVIAKIDNRFRMRQRHDQYLTPLQIYFGHLAIVHEQCLLPLDGSIGIDQIGQGLDLQQIHFSIVIRPLGEFPRFGQSKVTIGAGGRTGQRRRR